MRQVPLLPLSIVEQDVGATAVVIPEVVGAVADFLVSLVEVALVEEEVVEVEEERVRVEVVLLLVVEVESALISHGAACNIGVERQRHGV